MRRELEKNKCCRDAVLVGHHGRIHAVAQSLLVAEREFRHARDPLETRKSCGVPDTRVERNLPEHVAGHDRLCERTVRRLTQPSLSLNRPPAEQPADLVARQHAPIPLVGHRCRTSIRIGIVGDDDVRLRDASLCECQVHGTGFFGIGKCHGGKQRIRLLLGSNCHGGRESSLDHDAAQNVTADAMHSRGHCRDISRTRWQQAHGSFDVGSQH